MESINTIDTRTRTLSAGGFLQLTETPICREREEEDWRVIPLIRGMDGCVIRRCVNLLKTTQSLKNSCLLAC